MVGIMGGGRDDVSRSDVTGRFGYAKFASASAALDVAMMLGLNGIHSHQMDGNTIYMPGNTHKKLNKQLSKRGLETTMVPGSGSGDMGMGMGMNSDMNGGGMGSSGSEPRMQGMMTGTQPDDMMGLPEIEDDMEMPDLAVEPADPDEMELAQGPDPILPSIAEAPGLGVDMGMPDPDLEMPKFEPVGGSSHNSSHNDDEEDEEDSGTLYTS